MNDDYRKAESRITINEKDGNRWRVENGFEDAIADIYLEDDGGYRIDPLFGEKPASPFRQDKKIEALALGRIMAESHNTNKYLKPDWIERVSSALKESGKVDEEGARKLAQDFWRSEIERCSRPGGYFVNPEEFASEKLKEMF